MFKLFSPKSQPAKGEEVKLKISGMHCASCSMNIDDTLEEIPGVIEASTNYAKAESVVQYDPSQVKESALKKAIEGLGYKVV